MTDQFIMPIPLIMPIPFLLRFFITCSYLSLLLPFLLLFSKETKGERKRETGQQNRRLDDGSIHYANSSHNANSIPLAFFCYLFLPVTAVAFSIAEGKRERKKERKRPVNKIEG